MKRQIRPTLSRPPDFESFWANTCEELNAIDPEVRRTPVTCESHPLLELSQLTFHSLGGVKVSGYSLGWLDGAPRPLVVHSHGYGYGSQCDIQWKWAGGWIQRDRHRHSRLWPLGGGRARTFALGLCVDRNRVARDVRSARRGLRLRPHDAAGGRSLRGTERPTSDFWIQLRGRPRCHGGSAFGTRQIFSCSASRLSDGRKGDISSSNPVPVRRSRITSKSVRRPPRTSCSCSATSMR